MGASDTAYALLVCAWMTGMVCGATALARRVPIEHIASPTIRAAGSPAS